MDNTPLLEESQKLRKDIEQVKESVQSMLFVLKDPQRQTVEGEDKGEQIANAMLAFRHLEDAKMRIGKVIQATVGKSVYDK
jgi:hypothetical protein